MTQYIAPNAVAAMTTTDLRAPQYQMGQLALARGGLASLPRGRYAGGSIGGGIIQGTPMSGGRTGYWNPVKKILKKGKKAVKKLIPKEFAGAMQAAAPFMPWQYGIPMAALGSYKQKGRIDPWVMAGATLPHLSFGQGQGLSGIRLGGVNDAGRFGVGDWLLGGQGQKGVLNFGKGQGGWGTAIKDALYGSPEKFAMGNEADGLLSVADATEGLIGSGGDYMGAQDLIGKMVKGATMTDGKLDMMKVVPILYFGKTYIEAKKLADNQGIDIGSEEQWLSDQAYWQDYFSDFASASTPEWAKQNLKSGGRARAKYAMGSAQFPPQKRTGLQWGSDKGEGLGGMEVEADMRYDGGFMPYGEEPKADDVPARLSKDEFVFTDEAVAGAGDGDVNVGAERLYNVMKNLEQGGRLSEETEGQTAQGLGAMV